MAELYPPRRGLTRRLAAGTTAPAHPNSASSMDRRLDGQLAGVTSIPPHASSSAAASSVPPFISAAAQPPSHGASTMDGRLARQLGAAASVPPHVSAAAPPPPHGASSMAINHYKDFFSQASTSTFAASESSGYPAYLAADEFGLSFQALTSPFASSSQSAPHMPMENLDLNSQVDSFPHLDIFPNQEQLQGDGARGSHGLPPIRTGSRGRVGQFQPPRSSGGRTSSGNAGRPAGSAPQVLPPGGIGGGGLRGRQPNRIAHGSTSARAPVNADDEDDLEEGDDNDHDPRFLSKDYDKAHWSDQNIYYFCELFLEQVRNGNWNNGTMTSRGYIAIRKKYYRITNLWHDTKCMKNRVTNCRTMYLFWLKLNKNTGLGRKPDGTIDATPEWWKENTKAKGQSECRKFQKGNPIFLDLLIEMFQGVAVDGSSSCIPGEEEYDVEGYDASEVSGATAASPAGSDADGFGNSPMSISSHKRASSSATTVESPSKKRKAPLLNMMRGLVAKFDEDSKLSNEKLDEYRNSKALRHQKKKQDKQEHIDRCLAMAMECGASEETEEFFMATKLFEKEYNRNIFCKLTTLQSRLLWLRRWCQGSSG